MVTTTRFILAVCTVLPISGCVCGCPSAARDVREGEQLPSVAEQLHRELKQANGENHAEGKKLITADEARDIANRHFRRAQGSGLYCEDRGQYFFVAPPIKTRKELEEAGILISKDTGEISLKLGTTAETPSDEDLPQ